MFRTPLVCCWKIPRTAAALSTTGLHEAVQQLGILRADPGQVLVGGGGEGGGR